MTSIPKVLLTDFAWPSVEVERGVLNDAGFALVIAAPDNVSEIADQVVGVQGILTCFRDVTARDLDAATQCRTVARLGVGLDNIDVERATELGIVVTNVPGYCDDEVSDHAAALILTHYRNIVAFARDTANGRWDKTAQRPMRRMRGQTLGLIGFGRIAQRLATKMRAFGMDVIAYSPSLIGQPDRAETRFTSTLQDLLRSADVISIHVPLTEATHGMIDAAALAQMKPSAFLVNTARGSIVDTEALATAVADGTIAGAGLDVLENEPPTGDQALLRLPHVIVTPHAAFDSVESIRELRWRAATNVVDVLQGRAPSAIANREVLASSRLRAQLS